MPAGPTRCPQPYQRLLPLTPTSRLGGLLLDLPPRGGAGLLLALLIPPATQHAVVLRVGVGAPLELEGGRAAHVHKIVVVVPRLLDALFPHRKRRAARACLHEPAEAALGGCRARLQVPDVLPLAEDAHLHRPCVRGTPGQTPPPRGAAGRQTRRHRHRVVVPVKLEQTRGLQPPPHALGLLPSGSHKHAGRVVLILIRVGFRFRHRLRLRRRSRARRRSRLSRR
mmetsp:Transcript_18214/g.59583  ORF Transcript_18214/g.59583 Transcript_18214/m.59583 type:complete len:225 (-) Transcript_18214:550-1224(-)